MPRLLSITNKLLSLRGRILVTVESDKLAYEAKGEFALLSPTWLLFKNGVQVLSIRRRIFAWAPTWDVQGSLGSFVIKRRLFSWSRRYYAAGGDFGDAQINGNLWGLNFEILRGTATIASARGTLLTLRDRQTIEVIEPTDTAETFTVCAMVVLHLDRKSEAETSSSNGRYQ
jgi:uncharacterized protein YxjI